MADDVSFESETHGSHAVVRPVGYLDVSTSPRFREKLAAIAAGSTTVIVDLGSIEFIDSTALGVLLGAWKQLTAAGGTLAVVSPQERITKIFQITALDLSMSLYSSLDEAKAALAVG